ncbi:FAD-dependent oxidoreductase [Raoultibacter massiliensis]|uniref:FAD-dependent oxidoreductase n=1 Tax=Raoultibacter massiliensis TaxID=1852371 RepID=UPI003A8EAF2E
MNLTRRNFFKGASVAGASIMAASIVGCSAPEPVAKEATPEEENSQAKTYAPEQSYECDLAIIGAGNSGMCAAIEATALGLNVILIEKSTEIGGSSFATEVIFGLGSKMQAEANLDLPYRYQVVNEELSYTNHHSDPLLWGDYVDHSGENIDWLQEQGVPFDSVDDYRGVSAFDTAHWWEGKIGTSFLESMTARIGELGIETHTGTSALDLKTEGGKVIGLYAETGDGKVIEYNARAVLLACGGIGNDLALLQEKTGIDTTHAKPEFPLPNVGDGHRMAWAVGAKETDISILPCLGVDGFVIRDAISMASCIQPGLYINGDGERFMAEDLHLKKLYALVINAQRSQLTSTYTFFDNDFIELLENGRGSYVGNLEVEPGDTLPGLREQLETGSQATGYRVVYKGETLEDLATDMGANPETLQATILRYNELCEKGIDEDFGKDSEYMNPVGSGPYYAVHTDLSVLTTFGGVGINRNMQVIDGENQVIPGLYSSGVTSCGLYQDTYNYQISGGMNGYCTYSGRHAAQQVAQDLKQ